MIQAILNLINMLVSRFSLPIGQKAKIAYWLLGLFLLIWLPAVQGQIDLSRFNHLTSDEGLSSNATRCLLKDSQGFLWIGTDAGLSRFDGNQVRNYTHTIGDPGSLANNSVISLFEDSKGRIWVGTAGGLSILEPEANQFINFIRFLLPEDTIDFKKPVESIRQFKNNIWIATRSDIITTPLDSFSFKRASTHFYSRDNKPLYYLHNRAVVTSSGLWILSSKGPLYTEDGVNFFHRYHNPEHWPIFNFDWIASLLNDGDTLLYFTTFHYEGIYAYQPAHQHLDSIPFNHSPEANHIWVLSMAKLNENEIMGVSNNNGVFRLNIQTGLSQFYTPDPNNPGSVNSYHGDQILIDQEKTIFLATDRGLAYQNPSKSSFTVFNTLNSLVRNMKVCMTEDDEGNLWFGTVENGLVEYVPGTGKMDSFQFPGPYNRIWSMYYENHSLWLGTSGGLSRFSTISKKFSPLNNEVPKAFQDLTDGPSTNILKDPSGSFWITLFPYGLVKYNFNTRQFISFTVTDSTRHLPGSGTITAACIDNRGILWCGFTGGEIAAINTEDNAIRIISPIPVDESEITGKITGIVPDQQGDLWIGTSQTGIHKYSLADSTFCSYDTRQNLSSNNIGSMVFDGDGMLWITTDKGLNRFNPLTKIFTLYDKSDGLPGNQFNYSAGVNNFPMLLAKNGIIYFTSDAYLISFDPKTINANPNFPVLVVHAYRLAGKEHVINSHDQRINFTYKDRDITFDFFGINFIDPAKTQFAYKLEGFDVDWIKNGSSPYVSYSSLPVGDHLLRVRTTNKPDHWGDQEVSMMIHVTGPFWGIGRVVLLCLIIFSLVFYTIYSIRLSQLKKIQSIRQKISRDLHDEIGSTLSSISINSLVAQKLSQASNPELTPVLQHIGEYARSAMDDMNDIVWAINPAHESFSNIMERIQIFASSLLAGKNIKFRMDISDSLQGVRLNMQQRKNIYLILREAVHNVAKYSKARHCLITGTFQEKMISLQVADDGAGFEKRRPGLGGNGLNTMQERAYELSAQLNVQSEKLKGTRISLQLPLR